jgi:Asp-tRNA(Asn)/Glu-tRNA(Gln) amidotransferase A subunit family amidase
MHAKHWFDSAIELARAIRTRTPQARDLLEGYLDRTDRYSPGLDAIVAMVAGSTRAATARRQSELRRTQTQRA